MCMQMLDHSGLKVSLVIDGGKEEMKSWVWRWSGRSKSSTQTLYTWHTGYPWCKSRTCLRPCSARWLVYHGHGFDYFDDSLEPWCATMIRTPLLLPRLRYLGVIHFVLPCIFWWLGSPTFVLWHLCITTFWMFMKNFYDDRFIYLHV